MAFGDVAAATKRPTYICTGTIRKVHDAQPSKKEDSPYYSAQVEIESDKGSPRDKVSLWITFRPEWLSADFDTSALDRSGRFVYRSNIASSDNNATLQQLLDGSFGELSNFVSERGQLTEEDFVDFIRQQLEGRRVVFSLGQSSDLVEVADPETGETKKKRVLTDQLEVKKFYGEKSIANLERLAEAEQQRFEVDPEYTPKIRLTWESGDDLGL